MADSCRYERVRAMLALSDSTLRGSFRQALRSRGFTQILETETADTVEHALGADHVDLLIATPDLRGTDLCAVLQDHRQSRLGPNPFTVVLTMLDCPTDDRVRWAAGSGADDVLQAATRPEHLMVRIESFAKGRKPFIVTHDYIGPARTHVVSDVGEDVARIEVPNPVRWRLAVNGDMGAFDRAVVSTAARINLHKVNRTAVFLDQLVGDIVSAHYAGEFEQRGRPAVDNLARMAADLAQRVATTPFASAWELLESMQMLCRRMGKPGRPVRDAEIAILPQLSHFLGRIMGDAALATASADSWRKGLRDADFSLVMG